MARRAPGGRRDRPCLHDRRGHHDRCAIPTLVVDETDLTTDASADFSGIFTTDIGEDTPGTVTYALVINGGDGTDSGLDDTASGEGVLHYNEGGDIAGRTSGGGDEVFRVSVDGSGTVTLDQVRAVIHPDTTDPDDIVSPSANTIGLQATVTDKDGDSFDQTRNISANLDMKDDGPSISPAITD